jgi:nucleoid DNA-binding protein
MSPSWTVNGLLSVGTITVHSFAMATSQKLTKVRVKARIFMTLVLQGRVELRNLGIFAVKKRKPRKARNPRTGEQVDVPARLVVTFKPGRAMLEQVNWSGHVPDAEHGSP